MRLISPVFHPRARVSAEVETLTARVMRDVVAREGHVGRAPEGARVGSLGPVELGMCRLAAVKIREGGTLSLVARDLGLEREQLKRLMTRAGHGPDGTEVIR